MASQVHPPLFDKEMVSTFIGTFHSPFYDKMIGNVSSNFLDIITIKERIKYGVKTGRIVDNSVEAIGVKKPTFNKKKEGKVHTTSYERQERKPQQAKPIQPHLIQPFPPQFM